MSCQQFGPVSHPYLFEPLECRRLLSAAVQYVPQAPDGTLLPPVNFNADLAASAASVQQFTAAQRSLSQTGFASSNYDTFLRLDGVTGEATAVSHAGEIPILSFNAVQNGGAIGSGAGRGATPQITAMHFVANVSRASPQLTGLLLGGADIATADLSMNTRGASPYEFYHVHLENARVTSYQVESGNALQEEFTLVFQKATITYTPRMPNGMTGTPVQYQIDTAVLGATVAPFQPTQDSLLQAPINPFAGSEFLRLDGINGDATAAGHVGQIALDSFGFATAATSGAGRANYSSIHVLAPLSMASPKLMEATASGQIIPTADLSVVSSASVDIYGIHLVDVIISSHQITSVKSSGDGLPREQFTLSFAKMQIAYHFQPSGQPPQTVQFEDDAPSLVADSLPLATSVLDAFFPPPTQSMYVRLDGVTGGTFVDGQPNELPALAFSWGEQGPPIFSGMGGGSDHFQDLHVVTPVSQASPQIESLAVSGRLVPITDFIILPPGASTPSYHIHLQNVFVTSYHLSTARDGQLEEEFTLNFTNVTVEKTTQAGPGDPGTTVTFQRDLARQGDVLDDFVSTQEDLLDQNFTPTTTGAALTIAGMQGDSTDARHPHAIDIVSFSTGVNGPRDAATGQAAGKRQFQPIHLISRLSSASPQLINAMVTGQTLATADLTVPSALSGINSYTIHLDNVHVVSDQIGTGPDGTPDEEFSLTYSGIVVTYVPQDPAGPGTPVRFAEDLQVNDDAIAGFAPAQQSLFTALGPQSSALPLQPPPPMPSSDGLFLTVAGVSGPSSDAAHPHSIPLVSWSWGADLPLDPGGSGAANGSPQFQVLHCLSDVSQASPQLMQLATSGQDIPTVELDARHAGASSDYYTLRLTDARVSSYQIKQGASLLEEFTLAFRKVEIHIVSNSGTPDGFTYDLSVNNAGLSDFAPEQASLANNDFELSPQQMFLSLPGIPGDSTDHTHPRQIVVTSFDWVESASGRVGFDDLHVVAPLSVASPLITQAVLTGTVIPTADLFVRRAGTILDYYTIHLDNVQITSQQIASGPDGSEVEEFTLHFGGAPGSIAGQIFNDINHNGIQDPGETGLAGVTVYLDVNHDATLDAIDPIAVTDSNGAYSVTDLAPGTYTVRQGVAGHFALTAPLGYAASATVSPGQTAVGPTFGDTQVSTVPLDFAYLLLLAQHYTRPGTFATGDLNGDGTVNFSDLLLVAQNYGHALPAASVGLGLSSETNWEDLLNCGRARRAGRRRAAAW